MNKQKGNNIMTITKETISLLEAEDMFVDFLDSEADIKISGMIFSPSDILRTMDPVAYREQFNNYLNYISLNFDIEGY
jgi:hypothetical protein